jgi:hypothetical protein
MQQQQSGAVSTCASKQAEYSLHVSSPPKATQHLQTSAADTRMEHTWRAAVRSPCPSASARPLWPPCSHERAQAINTLQTLSFRNTLKDALQIVLFQGHFLTRFPLVCSVTQK